jgi:RNA recognition motif-containing protein
LSVKNLNEYVKLETLKETLNAIFKHYGNIIDIEAKASLKRRGQAFIVYDAEQSAYDAALEMDGFELYGKTMKVDMAKTHSDKTLQLKATEDQFEQHKRERLTAKGRLIIGNHVSLHTVKLTTTQSANSPKKQPANKPNQP